MDKLIDQWIKNRSDAELSSLYPLIRDKDKQLWDKIGLLSFTWVTQKCKELHDLQLEKLANDKEISGQYTDAQFDYIDKHREFGVCVRCKSKLSGVIMNKNKEVDVYPIEYLFLIIHKHSGLCIYCIEEFLLNAVIKKQNT